MSTPTLINNPNANIITGLAALGTDVPYVSVPPLVPVAGRVTIKCPECRPSSTVSPALVTFNTGALTVKFRTEPGYNLYKTGGAGLEDGYLTISALDAAGLVNAADLSTLSYTVIP